MKKNFCLLVLLIIFLFLPKLLSAQQEVKEARELTKIALKQYEEKNYTAYLESMEKVVKLRPNHPQLTYNYAGALALTGNKKAALEQLNKFAEFGSVANPTQDNDFATIKDSPEFQNILKKIENNLLSIGQLDTFVKFSEKDLITEGLAYDPKEKAFYIGSIRKRKIVKIDKNGRISDFTNSQQDGLWGVFGMQVDVNRRILWVTSSSLPEIANFQKEEDSKAALFQYDLKTKKLLKKYSIPNTGKSVWGDLTLNSKGEIFITDSLSPNIYYLSPKKNTIEKFLTGPFVSPQGITFSNDDKFCFVSDYSQGVFKIDMKTKNVTKLDIPANSTLLGIDGIYFYENSLIAVQNGTIPKRIVKLAFGKNFSKIEKVNVLALSKENLPDPTLGTIVDKYLYLNANAQWDNFDRNGNIFSLDKFTEPTVLKISLKGSQ